MVRQEKLQSRSYSSKEEFFADFKQGLENVLAFYPQEHPAIDAAKQIWARFQVLWREASAKFQS